MQPRSHNAFVVSCARRGCAQIKGEEMPVEAAQGKRKHRRVVACRNSCVHLFQYRWKKQCKATTQSRARPSQVLSCVLCSAVDFLSLIPLSHIVTRQSGSSAVNGVPHRYNSHKGQPDSPCDSRSRSCCSCNGNKDHHVCPVGLKVRCWHSYRLAVTLRRCWGNWGGEEGFVTPRTHTEASDRNHLWIPFNSSLKRGTFPLCHRIFSFRFFSLKHK